MCVSRAGPHQIPNLGHGVIQETTEDAVGFFVDEAKKFIFAEIESFVDWREALEGSQC